MNYKENIGKEAFFIEDNKIKKGKIIEGRETTRLNMGDKSHGKLLPSKIEYRMANQYKWLESENVFFTKEDIIKNL
ncbi:MAG: hypothetical protein ACLFT4_05495 [Bacteroidales bacterium]